jgi:hypothetical protein
MPGFVVTVANLVMCSHAGKATPMPLPVRAFIMGVPVVTLSNPYMIVGCALAAVPSPPCVSGSFPVGSTRVFASIGAGLSPLLVIPTSPGTCVPTGQPLIPAPAGQQRVFAS